jgi:hypothetical protein
MDVEQKLNDLKRRVDQIETRLTQLEGCSEIVSGELREIGTGADDRNVGRLLKRGSSVQAHACPVEM